MVHRGYGAASKLQGRSKGYRAWCTGPPLPGVQRNHKPLEPDQNLSSMDEPTDQLNEVSLSCDPFIQPGLVDPLDNPT